MSEYRFGVEAEYASGAERVVSRLTEQGWANSDELHRYHCDCDDCDFGSESTWRAQRDSTVDGELISSIFDDWRHATDAFEALSTAAREVGATTSSQTGVHVHVSHVDGRSCKFTPAAYFLTERYIMELIAPGATAKKREMNRTMLTALRYRASEWSTADDFIGRYLPTNAGFYQMFRDACSSDRHMDLNYSTSHDTFEFRAYNGTLAEWRMELYARLSVAMVACADQIVTESLVTTDKCFNDLLMIGLRSGFQTKRPLIPLHRFVGIVGRFDPVLAGLLRRQTQYMRRRYATAMITPGEGE